MWNELQLSGAEISMLLEATKTSVYMTLASTLFAYIIGLPAGILLVVCAPRGLRPLPALYKVLDIVVNITRSVPFLILMLLATPLAGGDGEVLRGQRHHYFPDAGGGALCGEAGGVLPAGGG